MSQPIYDIAAKPISSGKSSIQTCACPPGPCQHDPLDLRGETAAINDAYEQIKLKEVELTNLILLVPHSRERSLALTKLEEMGMWLAKGRMPES